MQTPICSDASLECGSILKNFQQRPPLLERKKKLKKQWISISWSQLREGSPLTVKSTKSKTNVKTVTARIQSTVHEGLHTVV